jgi:2,3-bisphosphoglycerate-dependent phosphoglycerate mutase
MVKLKLYVFRHGQTYYNRDNKFTGFMDIGLTKTGKEDAKIVALRLKDKQFDFAFHTSLSRSKETLKEVLKFHPECRKIICDNRMIERGYGKLQGKTHLQIVEKYGSENYDKWHRGFNDRPPSGESFKDVEKRVSSFVKYIIKFMKTHKVNIAISAHGNSIRLLRKIMEKASEKDSVSWFIPYDNYYEYTIDA